MDPPLFTTAAWAVANWFPFAVVELFAISDRSMFRVPSVCAMAAPAAMAKTPSTGPPGPVVFAVAWFSATVELTIVSVEVAVLAMPAPVATLWVALFDVTVLLSTAELSSVKEPPVPTRIPPAPFVIAIPSMVTWGNGPDPE